MDKNDVPQDKVETLGGLRKAMYAVDENGKYTLVPSVGWEAEETVLNQAIEEFERQCQEARARVTAGESSPLEFHMYNSRMDVIVLAQSTGFFKWQVKRHLKPAHFLKLSPKQLLRYADALGISEEQLKTLPVAQ